MAGNFASAPPLLALNNGSSASPDGHFQIKIHAEPRFDATQLPVILDLAHHDLVFGGRWFSACPRQRQWRSKKAGESFIMSAGIFLSVPGVTPSEAVFLSQRFECRRVSTVVK